MKRIFQWIILYVIVFGVVAYFIYSGSDHGSDDLTMEDTKGMFSNMWNSIKDFTVSKFKEFSKKEIVNETTFYKLKPKSCSLEVPFRCLGFEITNKTGDKAFIVNIKNIRDSPLRVKGASLSKGIECKSKDNIMLPSGEDTNITLYGCKVYEKYGTLNVFFQKEDVSTIIHSVNGVITLGNELENFK